jgi:hypothetical protein
MATPLAGSQPIAAGYSRQISISPVPAGTTYTSDTPASVAVSPFGLLTVPSGAVLPADGCFTQVMVTVQNGSQIHAVIPVVLLPSSTNIPSLLNPDGSLKSGQSSLTVGPPVVPASLSIDFSIPSLMRVTWANVDVVSHVPGIDPPPPHVEDGTPLYLVIKRRSDPDPTHAIVLAGTSSVGDLHPSASSGTALVGNFPSLSGFNSANVTDDFDICTEASYYRPYDSNFNPTSYSPPQASVHGTMLTGEPVQDATLAQSGGGMVVGWKNNAPGSLQYITIVITSSDAPLFNGGTSYGQRVRILDSQAAGSYTMSGPPEGGTFLSGNYQAEILVEDDNLVQLFNTLASPVLAYAAP